MRFLCDGIMLRPSNSLGITIHQQGLDLGSCKRSCQIDGGGGLSYSAFLVCNSNDVSHGFWGVGRSALLTLAKPRPLRNAAKWCMFHVEHEIPLRLEMFHVEQLLNN